MSKRSLETACSNSVRRADERMDFVLCVHTWKEEVLGLRGAMLIATDPGMEPFAPATTWVTGGSISYFTSADIALFAPAGTVAKRTNRLSWNQEVE